MMVQLNRCVFLMKDGELLKKYSNIWNKVTNSIEEELDRGPIYGHPMQLQIFILEKYLK